MDQYLDFNLQPAGDGKAEYKNGIEWLECGRPEVAADSFTAALRCGCIDALGQLIEMAQNGKLESSRYAEIEQICTEKFCLDEELTHLMSDLMSDLRRALSIELQKDNTKRATGAENDAKSLHDRGLLLEEEGRLNEAASLYAESAKAGYVEANNTLALLYYKHDMEDEAMKWWEAGAKSDNTNSQYNLALSYKDRKQYQKALYWLERAAEDGSDKAVVQIGSIYRAQGQMYDAVAVLKPLADKGNSLAQHTLADVYRQMLETAKAIKYHRMAADQGDAESMTELGFLLLEQGCYDEAARYFQEASDDNPEYALAGTYAYAVLSGDSNLATQLEASVLNLKKARCKHMVARALRRNGLESEACRWAREATVMGFEPSVHMLTDILVKAGRVTDAEPYLMHFAKKGSSTAIFNLAALYYHGQRHFGPDWGKKATAWAVLAARLKMPDALRLLNYIKRDINTSTWSGLIRETGKDFLVGVVKGVLGDLSDAAISAWIDSELGDAVAAVAKDCIDSTFDYFQNPYDA